MDNIMSKITAVEWLGIELNMLFTDITEEQWNRADELFEQAKEMEKQQIMDAFNFGVCDGGGIIKKYKMSGEQYYNEIFKTK